LLLRSRSLFDSFAAWLKRSSGNESVESGDPRWRTPSGVAYLEARLAWSQHIDPTSIGLT
jgi:hypothetical protein